MLCETCPFYAVCTQLCRPAERYVDQDRPGANTRVIRWYSADAARRELALHAYRVWHDDGGAESVAIRLDLSVLTVTQRLIVECLYYEGLSTRETAHRIGLTQSSLFRKLNRAKFLLRDQLQRSHLKLTPPLARPQLGRARPSGRSMASRKKTASPARRQRLELPVVETHH